MFDKNFFRKLQGLAPDNFLSRGELVLKARYQAPIKDLIEHRTLPEEGWDDEQIKFFLELLAAMDTDKDPAAARVGEREARVSSPLVDQLAAGFCHGIGRSGNVVASQPKAPGGSVMYQVANQLARSFLKQFGLPNVKEAVVLPMGTGMSLFLCLATVRSRILTSLTGKGAPNSKLDRKKSPFSMAKFPGKVLLPRCDHNSPLKGIELAGFEPVIIPGHLEGDGVGVSIDDIANAITPEVAAIASTLTFFPPRLPDPVKEIAKLAREHNIAHIINNAYGVQHPSFMKQIYAATSAGRVDFIIQSTDKNFLTPVGGSVVAAFTKGTINELTSQYAGRATAAPVVQFLAAALSLGQKTYKTLQEEQQENRRLLQELLEGLASSIGERVLQVENPIAAAMSLEHIPREKLTAVGGALYNLRVTGPRIMKPDAVGWGTNIGDYPVPYVVMNAAIGSKRKHITSAVERLGKAIEQVSR